MGLCGDTKVESIHKMLQVADEMLYKAKNEGRNQIQISRDYL
jgi:PleD family two-component response regulator